MADTIFNIFHGQCGSYDSGKYISRNPSWGFFILHFRRVVAAWSDQMRNMVIVTVDETQMFVGVRRGDRNTSKGPTRAEYRGKFEYFSHGRMMCWQAPTHGIQPTIFIH